MPTDTCADQMSLISGPLLPTSPTTFGGSLAPPFVRVSGSVREEDQKITRAPEGVHVCHGLRPSTTIHSTPILRQNDAWLSDTRCDGDDIRQICHSSDICDICEETFASPATFVLAFSCNIDRSLPFSRPKTSPSGVAWNGVRVRILAAVYP